MESRFRRLEKSSARCEELLELVGRAVNIVEGVSLSARSGRMARLPEVIAPIMPALCEMDRRVTELKHEIAVERGWVDNFTGFVLPRLGTTAGSVEEVQRQMLCHRWQSIGNTAERWLHELRGAVVAGITSAVDILGARVLPTEGAQEETTEFGEAVAAVQKLQEDMRAVQDAMGSIEAEIRRVERDGDLEA